MTDKVSGLTCSRGQNEQTVWDIDVADGLAIQYTSTTIARRNYQLSMMPVANPKIGSFWAKE